MNRLSLSISVALLAAACASSPTSAATVVSATQQSWCHADFGCPYYVNAPHTRSPFTGRNEGLTFHGYFLFDIPVGNYSAATISIYNDGRNYTQSPGDTFTLRAASAINFNALGTGTVLGSANVGSIDTGVSHFETITLNSAAVALLNGAAGHNFLFGGAVGDVSVNENQLFGYVDYPQAAYLTLTSAVSAVPEPATWALLILGFGAVGGAMRRRRVRVAFAR